MTGRPAAWAPFTYWAPSVNPVQQTVQYPTRAANSRRGPAEARRFRMETTSGA